MDKKEIQAASGNIGKIISFRPGRYVPGEPETITGRIIGLHYDKRGPILSYRVSVPCQSTENPGLEKIRYVSVKSEFSISENLDERGAEMNERAAVRKKAMPGKSVAAAKLRLLIEKEKKAVSALLKKIELHEKKLNSLE